MQGTGKKLQVKQFRYSSDNLGYLIHSNKDAIAVDGGAVEDILNYLKNNNINLKYIINTHSHGDHTVGNQRLLKNSDARYIDYMTLLTNGIGLENKSIEVINTPGHTADSVIFKIDDVLLTGDTLFIGKIGRCFSGDTKGYFESIKRIMKFSDDSVILPGHDYVVEYMDFVRKFDTDIKYIDKVLANYDPGLVVSTLGLEKKLNPFLRINDQKIIALLKTRNLPCETDYDRWESMISLM